MYFIALVLLVFAISGCEPTPTVSPVISSNFDRNLVVDIVTETESHAAHLGTQLKQDVVVLQQATEAFLSAPGPDALDSLKAQWKAAHLTYAAAQFGFLDTSRELTFRVDAWPIQPGFIDALPEYPSSGIISDENLNLDAGTLIDQHGITDDEEVALGFHSMEYLIFARHLGDYQSEDNAVRRQQFLSVVAKQLVSDTTTLVDTMTNQYQAESYTDALAVLQLILSSNLRKLRDAFRESNLVTSEDIGHAAFSGTSLETVQVEINSIEAFMVGIEPMGTVLKVIDKDSHANFEVTLSELKTAVRDGQQDEATRAKVPLLLSALIHQMESFNRLLPYQLPSS